MPKIIENPEGKLIEEAKKQISEFGYSAMTIRSVAKGCGMGIGTVYHYFPSKEALLATYMLADWKECMAAIDAVSIGSEDPKPVILCMYDQLLLFARRHHTIFADTSAAAAFAGSFSKYHELLRSQLAAPVRKFCATDFSADFIAESLLTWTMAGKPFDAIFSIIEKLF